MRPQRVAVILVGAILGACISVRNTPEQDLVWSAYNQCRAEGRIPNNVQFVRVEPKRRFGWGKSFHDVWVPSGSVLLTSRVGSRHAN